MTLVRDEKFKKAYCGSSFSMNSIKAGLITFFLDHETFTVLVLFFTSTTGTLEGFKGLFG